MKPTTEMTMSERGTNADMSNTVTKGKVSTVYKRELALMLRSNIGWIFMAVNVAALCIFTAWLCIKNGYPTYEYAAETAASVNCIAAAFLCAFTVSAEGRRGETAMLSRFVSPVKLAIGKYLAQLTLFAVPTVISALLPLLLLPYGTVDLLNCYMGAVGYILTGMAILAFSSFVCSLIKHKWVAFGVTAVLSLLLNIASNVAKVVEAYQTAYFVFTAAVIIAVGCVFLLLLLDNTVIPVVFACVFSVLTFVFSMSGVLDRVVRGVISFISPQYSFSELIYGTVSVTAMIQPVFMTVIYLIFFSLKLANGRRDMTFTLKADGKEEN